MPAPAPFVRSPSRDRTPYRLDDVASANPEMRTLIELARRVAIGDCSLLVLGETGVGKEWLARMIHGWSPRAAAPFVALNCAGLADTLLESELFGHEKGAFTGAVKPRRGFCELAHHGTLFLDEIGDMPSPLQAKLLRFLEDHSLVRVGGEKAIEIDVRVIAATHHDLTTAAGDGFRRDLFYRLATVVLPVPPLRQRREDIPALVENHLVRFRQQLGRAIDGVSPAALAALVAYPWPGNVRELIHVVERAVLLCRGSAISVDDLPDWVGDGVSPAPPVVVAAGEPTPLPHDWLERPLGDVRRDVVRALERDYLERQLWRTGGRVGETARRAGLTPRSLYSKMTALGLRKEDFRPSTKRSPVRSGSA